jgi:hypothetical protein
VAGCCECGDEPSGSCATELVSYWGGGVFSSIAAKNGESYCTSRAGKTARSKRSDERG